MDEERLQKTDKLARDILTLSRNTLIVNLRFLDSALSQFTYAPYEESTLLTDGHHLLYNARHVLQCFQRERAIPVRDYLHVVLHCVFLHMFMGPNMNRPLWDLACDIAVESTITELDLPSVAASRQQHQQEVLKKLHKDLNMLTAEKLYRYFQQQDMTPEQAADLRGLFYADDHEIWYMSSAAIAQKYGIGKSVTQEEEQGEKGTNPDSGDGSEPETATVSVSVTYVDSDTDSDSGNDTDSDSDTDSGKGTGTASNAGGGSETEEEETGDSGGNSDLEQTWKDISESIQQDLQTFSRQRGNNAGTLLQNLAAVNRERYDYEAFLRKFAVRAEVMKIDPDDFDYIFYTYGLQLYRDMPLIEPLEYREEKRIREFVIAIDTSGSVSGPLVQTFVQKTYNVLKSTESFFSKINLHIIQCDADIQEDAKITSQEEFDEYLKTMKLRGLGGTDFRPVFRYVDELIAKKEFLNLKGLIYFTDGYGVFPSQKPGYDTAFVFIDDNYSNIETPPWAIKLVLQKDEI